MNSSSVMSASYMNTNGTMGATNGNNNGKGEKDEKGEEVDGEGEKENTMQRAVVAAWLLVKEASAMLALLVEISPPPLVLPLSSTSSNPSTKSDITTSSTPTATTISVGIDDSVTNNSVTTTIPTPIPLLLSVKDISTVGAVILDALGRLKHMGAIAEAHAALQSIAESLFK